ncbi:hypothetical protein QUF88_17090 [Bacillus sp. DX1.1]|uniref:hypothetical protein n=1 Tax=unclassified Bacillus (in: firmicutes) TaxID=185979 RepID=UPI00256FF15F|nr:MULTISPECIES: hypothetical protein [unclassified Bacillus (in: firmicutes)]MDM5155456.1 hypothetical protein [Bacillus sp. DX1.1]WJE79769.1 hypothetical protein QRE67_14615 [Bacillus sp. DX3.1]
MYRELDDFISAETTEDAWYDDGCIIVSEILTEFSPKDWEELSSKVLTKPLEWQKKLAYCMDSNCNMYELTILLSLLSVEDEELFEICIDTLRSFTTLESKQMILADPSILHRVNDLLPKASISVKKILEDFLMKIHS